MAALIVGSQGRRDASHGELTLTPRTVENGFYGRGIVNALTAVLD